MKQFNNLTIKKSESDQRLDVFLASKLDLSRSQAQKQIKQGVVLVNDKVENSHYKVQAGDKIKILSATKQENKKTKSALPKFKTIAETDDYLVINKPSGVIVHGGEGITEATLVDALEKKYSQIKKVGDDSRRPGIVHRLDKEASGLMIIAKNNKTFEHLKKQFQKRAVAKQYYALIYGTLDTEHDEINFPIARSAKGYKMSARPANQEGRQAVTEFEIEQKFINYTLLDVKIKTGRTHQIRVHLSAYGHPIVGDNLYATKKTREQNKKLNLNRIFLHAYTLGFNDLQGEWQEFKIQLPSELKLLLKKVK